MDIKDLPNADPEVWKFPSFYRALERPELAAEQLFQQLIDDLRDESDPSLRARRAAQDGDIALASLLEYGDIGAIDSDAFIFRRIQQDWWTLVTDEMERLNEKLREYRVNLPPELAKDLVLKLQHNIEQYEKKYGIIDVPYFQKVNK